ncbi:MAG: hypothetical protein ACI9P5_004909 [Saprospiraceae bacterium]|mgnify:CR=1 FL=1|jgi:hypothetical protein|tara:strand:+ start:419 stop:637 length:219 start_codon:yes stop_codon:yes gene_type:complete
MTKKGCKNRFIVLSKPIRQENIKIVFIRIRIFPGENCQWAKHFEYQQDYSIRKDYSYTNPGIRIDPIYYSGI